MKNIFKKILLFLMGGEGLGRDACAQTLYTESSMQAD